MGSDDSLFELGFTGYAAMGIPHLNGEALFGGLRESQWIAPGGRGSALVLGVLAHEVRHGEIEEETGRSYHHVFCDGETGEIALMDQDLAYMGAYAISYYLNLWLAEYSDEAFLTERHQRTHRRWADGILATWFCEEGASAVP